MEIENKKENKIFDYCFFKLMQNEGVYFFDKDDKGGETKYGISKKSYPLLDIKNLTLDKAKEIYKNDFYKIIWPYVINLNNDSDCLKNYSNFNSYKENQKYAEGMIKAINVQLLYFDSCVNHGIKPATKILQKSLNDCYFENKDYLFNKYKLNNEKEEILVLIEDGVLGQKTIKLMTFLDIKNNQFNLHDYIIKNRIKLYFSIIKNDNTQIKFANGWVNRCFNILNECQIEFDGFGRKTFNFLQKIDI